MKCRNLVCLIFVLKQICGLLLSNHPKYRNSPNVLFALNQLVPDTSSKQIDIFKKIKGIFTWKPRIERSDDKLKKGIAKFYDESTQVWLDVWGDDLHHGYYESKDFKDHKLAQIIMIDKALEFGYGINEIQSSSFQINNMVDVGCGVGGSSRHISKKYGSTGIGLSLSKFQILKANEITEKAQLQDRLKFIVADAMNMPLTNNTFDLTWSMESGEHMPDKSDFMKELFRVTAPGGRIIIVTWCHRELLDNEENLSKKELRLLDKINDAYYLPKWVPASKYVELATNLGLEDVRQDDWSKFIAPFWGAVFMSALKPQNFFRMMLSGFTTIKGFIATLWMLRGFKTGLIKFALITGRKKVV